MAERVPSIHDLGPLAQRCRSRTSLLPLLIATAWCGLPSTVGAEPTVVPTAEGQLGEMPGADDRVGGTRFESIRGQPGEVLLGGLFVSGGQLPPPPAVNFQIDVIKGEPDPQFGSRVEAAFDNVSLIPPPVARSRNAADNGDFVAFSFAVDGALPQTMSVRIATFDETGSSLIEVPVDQVGTFPDPAFNDTGVAVDNSGRVTVVYTDLPTIGGPAVKAQRIDGVSGQILDPDFVIGVDRFTPDAALLDPAGNRLIVATTELGPGGNEITGNLVDFTGPVPLVLADFPISTTPAAFGNINPAVAADPATGVSVAVWEHFTGEQGDPVDIRARRYDADGNPVGGDFPVNTTTANAQGQPAAAFGTGGESVIVWAGDAAVQQDELDVFAQAYDANGNPIGGEQRVNSFTPGVQDRPGVRFLPEPDARGQPQFVVAWRDVGQPDGSQPRGTGTSYKCFSIGEDPSLIFEDGFESGDTTSWGTTQP